MEQLFRLLVQNDQLHRLLGPRVLPSCLCLLARPTAAKDFGADGTGAGTGGEVASRGSLVQLLHGPDLEWNFYTALTAELESGSDPNQY